METVTEHWSPHAVGCVNDAYVDVAKVRGELMWRAHADEECSIVLIEPVSTEHTGDAVTTRTRSIEEQPGASTSG